MSDVSPGAKGSTGPYVDAGPRIPVMAVSLMDICWRCSWSAFQVPGGYNWTLRAVHAQCPEHGQLRKSWKVPAAP